MHLYATFRRRALRSAAFANCWLLVAVLLTRIAASADEPQAASKDHAARARLLIESLLKERERLVTGEVQVRGSRVTRRAEAAPENTIRGSHTFDNSRGLLRFDGSRRMRRGRPVEDVEALLRYVKNKEYVAVWHTQKRARGATTDNIHLSPPSSSIEGLFAAEHYMLDLRACGLVGLYDVEQGYSESRMTLAARCKMLLEQPVVEVIENDGLATIALGEHREYGLTIDTMQQFCPLEFSQKWIKGVNGTGVDCLQTTRVAWTEIGGVMVSKSFSFEFDLKADETQDGEYCLSRFLCLWQSVNQPVDDSVFKYESFTDIPPLTYVFDARGERVVASGVWTDEGVVGPEAHPYEGTAAASESEPVAHKAPLKMEGERAGQERHDNALKMKFVWCPPGEFTMGGPEGDFPLRVSPVDVTLTTGFWLGRFEVTQSEWAQLKTPALWKGQKYVKDGDTFPATYLSWENAMAFCAKLTARERKAGRLPAAWEYTLPTEAQWEYACRAGTKTLFSFGDDPSLLPEYAWFRNNASAVDEHYAHAVGQKKPNAFGLYDMHGNVNEWCHDGWQAKLPGGVDPFVEPKEELRVFRGGCIRWPEVLCHSASRDAEKAVDRLNFMGELGFRVALSRVRK